MRDSAAGVPNSRKRQIVAAIEKCSHVAYLSHDQLLAAIVEFNDRTAVFAR
jgi:hypothetical protein